MTDLRRAEPEGNDSVATHPDLWRPLEHAMNGFDLDPAAGAEPEAIADERYTPEDNGLTSPWFGTVWLNPPFSEKGQWYRRLVDHINRGEVDRAVAIAPVDTSTDWFQDWFSTADNVAFLAGRDHYQNGGHGGSPSFSTMVGLWKPTAVACEVLQRRGVLTSVDNETPQQTLTEATDGR
jgi:hypothetical protein